MSAIRRFAHSFIQPLLLVSLLVALLGACRPMSPSSTQVEPGGKEAQEESAATNTTAPQASSPSTSAQSYDLVVLHTNDTWGYYDPCG
jgi:hypothetical protein